MLGFSLQKILVLVAVVGAVWYGFKLISRLQAARNLEARGRAGGARPPGRSAKASGAAKGEPEELVQCPVCATYVAARGAARCDRPDCPY